jgi:fatty-acyl-CoA synthase
MVNRAGAHGKLTAAVPAASNIDSLTHKRHGATIDTLDTLADAPRHGRSHGCRYDGAVSSPAKAWLRALQATAPVERGRTAIFPLIIEDLAERFDSTHALESAGTTLTYRTLAESVARYARWGLSQGLSPQDSVCLLMPNCPEYLAIWLGLTRIGVTVALLNTNLSGELLAHAIRAAAPRHLITAAALAAALASARAGFADTVRCWVHGDGDCQLPHLESAVGRESARSLSATECALPSLEDRALCIYTSGTTGAPKAANVSHYRIVQWTHWFAGMMELRPGDRMYNCLPMYHSIGGVVAVGAPLVGGGTVVLRERFSARDFWADVVAERCSVFQYIGELCRYLTASPHQEAETRHVLRLCCGNGLRADVWAQFQSRFRIPQILEYYAATEGSFSLYNCEGRLGSIGKIPAFLAQRAAVVLVRLDGDTGAPLRNAAGWCERCEPGEVGEAIGRLSGPDGARSGRFEGYADAQASKNKVLSDVFERGDAWYRTGDLMRQDGEGFFYFVDRAGDTFRWKGENVSTMEVLSVISAFDGVADAAVYGVTVPNHEGRAGMAALVVDSRFDLAAFRLHVAGKLPAYARPLFLRLVASLELTGTFRHRSRELAQQGFDPAQVADPLYFDDRRVAAYVKMTTALSEQLGAGTLRL